MRFAQSVSVPGQSADVVQLPAPLPPVPIIAPPVPPVSVVVPPVFVVAPPVPPVFVGVLLVEPPAPLVLSTFVSQPVAASTTRVTRGICARIIEGLGCLRALVHSRDRDRRTSARKPPARGVT